MYTVSRTRSTPVKDNVVCLWGQPYTAAMEAMEECKGVRIDPMTIDDYEPAMALWRATPGMVIAAVDSRDAFARYLARNHGTSFIARSAGRLAGAVMSGHDGRRGYIHHLAVDPAFRGRGIGRALAERCIAALAREGIDKVHAFVFSDNKAGLGFWRRFGWHERTDLTVFSHIASGDPHA